VIAIAPVQQSARESSSEDSHSSAESSHSRRTPERFDAASEDRHAWEPDCDTADLHAARVEIDKPPAAEVATALTMPPVRYEYESPVPPVLTPARISAEFAAEIQKAVLAFNARPGRVAAESGGRVPEVAVPQPDIHVSIGRIEVRALSDAPRAARSRPASPTVSLDEYLRRCAQRGER
jgi:hypothetical protein